MYFHVHYSQVLQLLLLTVTTIITVIIIWVGFSHSYVLLHIHASVHVSPTFLQPQAFALHPF